MFPGVMNNHYQTFSHTSMLCGLIENSAKYFILNEIQSSQSHGGENHPPNCNIEPLLNIQQTYVHKHLTFFSKFDITLHQGKKLYNIHLQQKQSINYITSFIFERSMNIQQPLCIALRQDNTVLFICLFYLSVSCVTFTHRLGLESKK